jgi:hypothetical protein
MYGYASVPNYNNRPTTTHQDILDLYDRAIALAIKEAAAVEEERSEFRSGETGRCAHADRFKDGATAVRIGHDCEWGKGSIG